MPHVEGQAGRPKGMSNSSTALNHPRGHDASPHGTQPSSQVHVDVVVEDDPHYVPPFGKDTHGHALYSALVTLTLGVLGSTVLPVPYAFSQTGIAAGAVTMGLVAAANDATCCMMIRAAAHTGLTTYEQLSGWAGGPRARVFTQVSLIMLLYGTLCGGLAFLSDVARVMVMQGLEPGVAPPLLQRDGRPVMVLTVLLVLLPLCLQRHIRQFEKAATVGVVVVVALCAIIVGQALKLGFPAVASGELDVLAVKVDGHLPEAFAVLGFAFYMQPMLMPLLKEMPAGPAGAKLTERAVHITLFGVACGVYGTVGIFGASIFGAHTESNIMVNDLLPGHRLATLVLYASLLVYLCCGMVTTHYALRASLDLLLVGPDGPFTWPRQAGETVGILTAATTVALLFPTQAEKIFALTGCTAVCLVCYCIPVYIHLAVERDKKRHNAQSLSQPTAAAVTAPGGKAAGVPSAAVPSAPNGVLDGGTLPGMGYGYVDIGGLMGPGSGRQQPSHYEARGLTEPLLGPGPSSGDQGEEAAQGGRGCGGGGAGCCARTMRRVREYALPAAIVAIGVGFSVAGLYVGLTDLLAYLYEAKHGAGAGGGDGGGGTGASAGALRLVG